MKILGYAASNNLNSINKRLVTYACELAKEQLVDSEIEVLDLNDFEMPLYRPDREEKDGIPEQAQSFFEKIGSADKLIISFAEYNGSYTAAYKNIFDWTSRIDQKLYQSKSTLVMATSPGKRGGQGVLAAVENAAPHFGMELKATFSLPSFYDNFSVEQNKISNDDYKRRLISAISKFSQ